MSDAASLRAAARVWIDGDPDPETRAELEALLAAGDDRELGERMAGALEFGTAGLRGIVGAGSARMNRAVVIRTTRGVAEYLSASGLAARPVVVGFDARAGSRTFAHDTIGVLLAAGLSVDYFEEPVPTPLVAYAARVRGAGAAIVITASHNPAEYNGYKLYGPDAIQIAPPDEDRVAAHIRAVGSAATVARTPLEQAGDRARILGDEVFAAYLRELEAARGAPSGAPPIRIAYSPLHGVGGRFATQALALAGYRDVHVVAAQADPDPTFPTLSFPNPEEPGALDRLLELSRAVGATIALANDPDADRLAAALPRADGSFEPLTGNQIGVLLADFLLARAPARPAPLLVCSIVSSPMFEDIARAHGARCERTLTGFKWIWTAGHELSASGAARFVFGCEEALGYSVGPLVRDKDGVGAAVHLADLAAECATKGVTLRQRLHALHRAHGLWCSAQKSLIRPGTQGAREIGLAMDRLHAEPPRIVGVRRVVRTTDYMRDVAARPRWLGAQNLVGLDLEGGGRVLIRPSGTEPKLKIYVDLRISLQHGDDPENREREVMTEARLLADAVASHLGLV